MGYYPGIGGDPSGHPGNSNSYYQSIVSQQQQQQLNQIMMQLQQQEQVKQQRVGQALRDRQSELTIIQEELRRQRTDAVQNLKAHSEQHMRQLAQEIRTDREDDTQQELDQIRLEMEMSLRHQKELLYQDFDIQQQRLRQKF